MLFVVVCWSFVDLASESPLNKFAQFELIDFKN